ncbi:MAG: hypothetical protein WCG47_14715 [Dermatophilaceae bacterium]
MSDQVRQLISAHMALFIVVTDMLDECPEGDATWLDAAFDEDYLLPDPERRRLRAAISGIPPRP